MKDLFVGRGGLSGIVERAAATDRLARCVKSALPRDVAAHVLGANLRGDKLVVIVDGAAWAAGVRFEARAIRQMLSDVREIQITDVSVRVRPPD